MSNRPFTAADDRFHFAELGDDWWATETAWFSFYNAERCLGGWLYTLVRPNIGTVTGGAWVWDASAHLPWEVLYSANYSALKLPRDQDLDHCRLPTGVAIDVLEPGNRYRLRYEDADRLSLDLEFAAVMAAEPLTAVGSTFGSAHHYDQFGRVSGLVRVAGEDIAIDCIAMRDRTWGRRPEHRPRQAAYVTGAKDGANGFLAVTAPTPDEEPIAYGFLRLAGETVSLQSGERRVVRDSRGFVQRIELRAVDLRGRTLNAVGEAMSRIVVNRHTFIDINSLIRWRWDGEEAWGEDQDMWPVHQWAEQRRRGSVDATR